MSSNRVYEIVNERILQLLAQGVAPWRRPWRAPGSQPPLPHNLSSRRPYRGSNTVLLHPLVSGHSSTWWLTLNQATERALRLLPGATPSIAVFFRTFQPKTTRASVPQDSDNVPSPSVPFLRFYRVFNLSDFADAPEPSALPEISAVTAPSLVVRAMANPPTIHHGGGEACYLPDSDEIRIPMPGHFDTPAAYYATLFHELAHSTLHPTRLARIRPGQRNTPSYAYEELVAELTAAFVCASLRLEGADPDQDLIRGSAAYIAHYRRLLEDEPRSFVRACADAQRAADYLLGTRSTAVTDSLETEVWLPRSSLQQTSMMDSARLDQP